MNQADIIKKYLLKQIPAHPNDIVAKATQYFGVSRTTVHRHLNALLKLNKIIKSGTTKQVTYYLSSYQDRKYNFTIKEGLSESIIWKDYFNSLFEKLPKNVFSILEYGFTEVFNNAIDHAQAKHIGVTLTFAEEKISLTVHDDGIGIFKHISQKFHFTDYKECLLHLTKGKLTTDPVNHSGEGLFFTSRAFDEFHIIANEICFYRDNLISDWLFEKSPKIQGTKIILVISEKSNRKLIDLFNQYTDLEDFSFNKTDLLVDLSKLEGERLFSRSQAKRLLSRIEPFQSITLDFSKVVAVGQGFVDELFRVYPLKNPQVKINYIHANEEVEFMIKRSISR